MKKRTFLSLTAIMIAGLMIIGLSSCEQKKPCEKENFGTVIVTNHTGQVIWVDCTQQGQDYNDERMLGIGQSTTYQMTPGQITEWAIEAWDYPDGSWYTDTYYLGQCDTHNDPWTSKKKSSKNLEKFGVKVVEFVEKNK
jgi:hypothetical protein